MYTPNIYLFLPALLYIVTLQVLSLVFLFKRKLVNPRKKLLFIVLLAFLLRFIPAVFFPFGSRYDVSSLRWTAGRVYEGSDIYYSLRFRHHHPYLPAIAPLLALFIKISDQWGIPFLVLLKLPTILFDSLIAGLIYIISKNFRAAYVYSFSAVGIIIGAYIGQFDSIPLFFLLLALFLLNKNKNLLSSFVLGIATAVKPWPMLFLPFFIFRQTNFSKKILLPAVFILPIICFISFYKFLIPQARLLTMLLGIAIYDSGVGWWGFSIFLFKFFSFLGKEIFIVILQLWKILLVIFILLFFKFIKKENVFKVTKWVILLIYVFSVSIGGNYFLWILPFAFITRDTFTKYYLLLVGGYFLLFGVLGGMDLNYSPPFTPQIFVRPYAFLIWLFFLLWAIKEVRSYFRDYIFRK